VSCSGENAVAACTKIFSRLPSPLVPGIDAIAAPVFDFSNKLVAVVCVVARSEAKITGWNGSAVRALAETVAEASARLGFVDGDALPNEEKQSTSDLRAPSKVV
jgi:DNA-binding IclR family transcriptional regulator